MKTTKDIFLAAARQGQAVHIRVHMEKASSLFFGRSDVGRRVFNKALKLKEVFQDKVWTLSTTLISGSIIPIGPHDVHRQSSGFSAIENERHTKFLKENDITVALISGVHASKCPDKTRADCLQRGITPIMIMDAIDLSAPDYDREWFQELAEDTWGKDTLTAMTEDIIEWVVEI